MPKEKSLKIMVLDMGGFKMGPGFKVQSGLIKKRK